MSPIRQNAALASQIELESGIFLTVQQSLEKTVNQSHFIEIEGMMELST